MQSMNVLVVGKGGREHALVQKLSQSPYVHRLYAAPGNAGMTETTCVNIPETAIQALINFVKAHEIDLTIVGPEAPLACGIVDQFHAADLQIFAPTQRAAMLESSKRFAKSFMQRHQIPSAAHAVFTDAKAAKAYVQAQGAPIVVKADGLASGKGVVVAATKEEAMHAIDDMLVTKTFKAAGSTVVIEEFMDGQEFTMMAFVNGHDVYPMISSRDHKRAYEQDEGPNTGGMGGYAPVPDVTREDFKFIKDHIVQKTADALVEEDRSFTGVLYTGLMMTTTGPKVIEYNTRFGDPETQVVLPLLENDLLQVFQDVLAGVDPELTWAQQFCTGVVLTSSGYPGPYVKGMPIPRIEGGTQVSFAGVADTNGRLVANGGRILVATAKHDTVKGAADIVYQALADVREADGFYYRQDIGT